nr:T9SS type A sorting domain-containing protein [Candidatus Neomarinimicrobiota bacterium]
EVYRNGTLIADLTDVVIGAPYAYEDMGIPAPDMYDYEIIPYNSHGNGVPAANSAWIGTDTPGAPTNVEAFPDTGFQLECTLQWMSPDVGGHGGYWTPGDWNGQKIYRDGVEIANLTGSNNTYTDNTVPANGFYSYSVSYYNNIGEGPAEFALPNPVYVGPPQFEEIPYDWIEISGIGLNTGITGDDQTQGPFDMGINFPFYDMSTYNQVWICSNGFISFGPAGAAWTGTPLPDPADPNNLVCPYWDDLSPNLGGAIYYYYDDENERFIVQYNNVPHYGTGGNYTFQTIFYPSGDIDFMYNELTPGTANATTVGIENQSGTEGVQVTHNGSGPLEPEPGMGIRVFSVYTAPPPQNVTIALSPIGMPITIPANGGEFSFDVEVANLELTIVNCDIWTMATLPNGTEYGPIINVNKTFNPQQSITRNRVQAVPGGAPAGAYTYDAYVGFYPGIVWDEDHFDFTKSAASDGGAVYDDWLNWGESFDDPESLTNMLPEVYRLHPAYPNPFNPSTTLQMDLPNNGYVKLLVYDITGREVARLADGWLNAGVHDIAFDASALSSGIYFACMKAEGYNKTQKLLLIK